MFHSILKPEGVHVSVTINLKPMWGDVGDLEFHFLWIQITSLQSKERVALSEMIKFRVFKKVA